MIPASPRACRHGGLSRHCRALALAIVLVLVAQCAGAQTVDAPQCGTGVDESQASGNGGVSGGSVLTGEAVGPSHSASSANRSNPSYPHHTHAPRHRCRGICDATRAHGCCFLAARPGDDDRLLQCDRTRRGDERAQVGNRRFQGSALSEERHTAVSNAYPFPRLRQGSRRASATASPAVGASRRSVREAISYE